MNATGKLHDLGQSIWLDNITRDLLSSGTLKRYIDELSVTGLTSNPTIFDHAIKNSSTYDASIRQKVQAGRSGEELFFDLALEDLTRAADLFKPVFERTDGVDGWVSLEVSPLLAHDTASTLAAAKALHDRAGRRNLFIKIPGTPEGLPAIEDLRRAADLFLPIHERTDGVDGWVSLEVSPLLAYDTQRTVEAAKALHARAGRRNLFIKIPGTPEGLPAIEEAIASGVPVNVTLLFSADHYRAAADAYLRGVERRVQAGHDPAVGSVASVFMSRWDVAVKDTVPADLTDTLALAVGLDVYRAYREVMGSERFQRLENAGARMQRLLWASTKTKDPAASDTLYVHGLAAPFTVNTMPDDTLKALFDHGEIGATLPSDGGDSEAMLARFASAGVDVKALAAKLQSDGAKSFVAAWNDLMERIDAQSKAVA